MEITCLSFPILSLTHKSYIKQKLKAGRIWWLQMLRIELQIFPNKWFLSSGRILLWRPKHQRQFQPRQENRNNKTSRSQTQNWLSEPGRNQGQWGRAQEAASSAFEDWPAASPDFRILMSRLTSVSESSYDININNPIILSPQVRKVRPREVTCLNLVKRLWMSEDWAGDGLMTVWLPLMFSADILYRLSMMSIINSTLKSINNSKGVTLRFQDMQNGMCD